MHNLKLLLPIFLAINIPVSIHGQNTSINCNQDSTDCFILSKRLDTINIRNIYNLYFIEFMLPPYKKRDCFCDLLIYTRLFDFLLENGLDLNYQIKKNPPRRVSSNAIEFDSIQINNNQKYSIFKHFLNIKESYEERVVKIYDADKRRNIVQDIENILKYRISAYPDTLKNILLGNYVHLTKEKLQADYDSNFNIKVGGKQ